MLSSIDLAPVRANLAARFLLPNAAAGMVIGKGGTQIRQIIDETGAKLKLSAKDETGVHTERVLTVGGSLEQICKAHAMIVLRMADDPTYASYHNTSLAYGRATPLGATPTLTSAYATIGAFAAAGVQPPTMYSTFIHHHQAPPPPHHHHHHAPHHHHHSPRAGVGGRGADAMGHHVAAAHAGAPIPAGGDAHRGAPGGPYAPAHIAHATGAPAHAPPGAYAHAPPPTHAPPGAHGAPPQMGGHAPGALGAMGAGGELGALSGGGMGGFGGGGMSAAGALGGSGFGGAAAPLGGGFGGAAAPLGGMGAVPPAPGALAHHAPGGAHAPPHHHAAHAPHAAHAGMAPLAHSHLPPAHLAPHAMDREPQTSLSVAVSDAMVGAVVGRGGAKITEIQHITGCRVKISQRGDYIPGTTNRTVTITGPLSACQAAQFLINQAVTSQSQGHAPPYAQAPPPAHVAY